MTLAEAIDADRAGRIEEAAKLYELAADQLPSNIDGLINLACIYWLAGDYGFSSGHNLSREFIADSGSHARKIIATARRRFPLSFEPIFWARYFDWTDYGEAIDYSEISSMLSAQPKYLEPAMYLYAASEGTKFVVQAEELLAACKSDRTCRSNYISSVIESTTNQAKLKSLHSHTKGN